MLVDRIWPRGVSREDAKLDEWLREISPSSELRTWFNHDPDKFKDFKKRYRNELSGKEDLLNHLVEKSSKGNVTLLYGAKDQIHNQAVVLKELLQKRKP